MSEVQNHPGSKHADSRLLDVVALVKRGDAMAFEELYRLTYKYAYFHAKSILHDDDEAWDLVQETYIAVYQHIDSLREERYVKSWISGIVFNLGMKRLRKKRDLLVDGENDFLFDALEDENTDVSPEKALDSKETAAIVREVIDRLPALQKAAVISSITSTAAFFPHSLIFCSNCLEMESTTAGWTPALSAALRISVRIMPTLVSVLFSII